MNMYSLPCEELQTEDHCLAFHAHYAGSLVILVTTNVLSVSNTREIYRVQGPTGPDWDLVRLSLPATVFQGVSECKHLVVESRQERESVYTAIYAAISDVQLTLGNCFQQPSREFMK